MTEKTLFEEIVLISKHVDRLQTRRPVYARLAFAQSEMGELAEEITIKQGDSYKEQGKDGIVGEAIDTIICLIDIIRHEKPNITEEELIKLTHAKGCKWIRSVETYMR